MNLGQLESMLKTQPDNHVCKNGFKSPHSYRGYYDMVSFEPARDVKVIEMKKAVEEALTKQFTGWKGGEYRYDHTTPVYFAIEGTTVSEEYNEEIAEKIADSICGFDD